tara:strand:+ start:285 stop:848 length:564 start_codon:yes stop_codon:yes gene_type:complete
MELASILPNEIIKSLIGIKIKLKIKKPRRSKFGDCKYKINENVFYISVNEGLDKNQFTITLLHELAHAITIYKYGLNAKPHGKKWKNEYMTLINLGIKNKMFTENIERALNKSMQNIKSSHIYDYDLLKELYKNKKQNKTLNDIKDGEVFEFKGDQFIKIKKLTKRYLCQNIKNQKKYYIHPLIEIK